jgi:DNA-binding NarL/FixJ family response regulator
MMNGRLLIVDDDESYRRNLEDMIAEEHHSWTIVAAGGVEEALDVLHRDPAIDVALVDMRMPRVKDRPFEESEAGLEVIRAVRERDLLTEIIVLTAFEELENVYKAFEVGATQYIDKKMPRAPTVIRELARKRMAGVLKARKLLAELEETWRDRESLVERHAQDRIRMALAAERLVETQRFLSNLVSRGSRDPEARAAHESLSRAMHELLPLADPSGELPEPGEMSPQEVVRRGEQIFQRAVRAPLTPEDEGKFVVIDVKTSDFAIGTDELETTRQLLARHPEAEIYAFRLTTQMVGRALGSSHARHR